MTKQARKVALVTGGAGGIGSEVARRLAGEGFAVAVAYGKSAEAARSVAQSIVDAGGDATAIAADVSNGEAVRALFDAVLAKYGRLDFVFNNAGTIIPAPVVEVTQAQFQAVFGVNVLGALFVLQESARRLAEGGRIVSTSSTMVHAPIAGSALYAGSKAALEAFTKALAKEVGAKGVSVNAIRVGATVPGMFAKAPPERQAAMAASSPFKRLGTPKDVAGVVAFLASDAGAWVTGQVLTVDGGAT